MVKQRSSMNIRRTFGISSTFWHVDGLPERNLPSAEYGHLWSGCIKYWTEICTWHHRQRPAESSSGFSLSIAKHLAKLNRISLFVWKRKCDGILLHDCSLGVTPGNWRGLLARMFSHMRRCYFSCRGFYRRWTSFGWKNRILFGCTSYIYTTYLY